MSSALYLTTKAGLHFTSQRRPDLQHTTHSRQPAALLSSKIPYRKLGSDIKRKVAVSIPSDSIVIPRSVIPPVIARQVWGQGKNKHKTDTVLVG